MGKRHLAWRWSEKSAEGIYFWGLFTFGLLIRTRLYLSNLSLWNDEAALALNIVGKSFMDLLHPLDLNQVAPIGFVWIERAAILILGNNEFSLRLLPFICGVATLPLVFVLVRKLAGPMPALLCLGIFTVLKVPIRYSAEVKPYSLELAVTLSLLLIAWYVVRRGVRGWQLGAMFLAGTIAVWLSFPAVFVLTGIGCVMGLNCLIHRQWSKLVLVGAVCSIWFLSFFVQLWLLNENMANDALTISWSNRFMPFPPSTAEDLKWFLIALLEVFKNPLRSAWRPLAAVMFIVGCIFLWRKDKKFFSIVLLPLAFHLLASGLKKYPFGNRLLLYAAPFFLIPITLFINWFLMHRINRVKAIGVLLLIATIAEPSAHCIKRVIIPSKWKHEEMRPVLAYVSKEAKPNDAIFLFRTSQYAFIYYRDWYGLRRHKLIVSEVGIPSELDMLQKDFARLRGRPRVWLLFGHGWRQHGVNMESIIVESARKVGQQMEYVKKPGAAGYLFDFDEPA